MTLACHVTAERDEPGGTEAVLLGSQQCGDDHVPPGLEAAIGAQGDAVPQPVAHEHLVDLGEAKLPRDAHVLDGREGLAPVPPTCPLTWM